MTVELKEKAGATLWQNRRRRMGTGINTGIAIILAGLALVMVNYLSSRYYYRWDVSSRGFYRLADKTKGLLHSLDCKISVVAFFQKNHDLFEDVRNLLKEYEYEAEKAASLRLEISFIDPDRDLARAKDLVQKYDVHDANVIVFESEGRTKYVELKDIVDYERAVDYSSLFTGKVTAEKRKVGFRGEEAFSSAIQSITQARRPVVYFVTGHAERDVEDYSEHAGYSGIATIIRRDNMEVKSLILAQSRGVPADCSLLVVAGPDRKFSQGEIDMLSEYLDKNGRVFFLLDPAIDTGLEPILFKWGIKLARDVVVGLTMTGRELVITDYGSHPITRKLKNVTTMFYMPRSVESVDAGGDARNVREDRPRVTILAACNEDGWADVNLDQSPPKYEPEMGDRPGPVSVAVAVEKGSVTGIDVEIKPTRIVVIGDSYFVSNGALKHGVGGNVDIFMSSMNWLIEREALMAITPKVPGRLRLDMGRKRLRLTYLLIAGAPSLVVILLGLAVWFRRRN